MKTTYYYLSLVLLFVLAVPARTTAADNAAAKYPMYGSAANTTTQTSVFEHTLRFLKPAQTTKSLPHYKGSWQSGSTPSYNSFAVPAVRSSRSLVPQYSTPATALKPYGGAGAASAQYVLPLQSDRSVSSFGGGGAGYGATGYGAHTSQTSGLGAYGSSVMSMPKVSGVSAPSQLYQTSEATLASGRSLRKVIGDDDDDELPSGETEIPPGDDQHLYPVGNGIPFLLLALAAYCFVTVMRRHRKEQ